MVGPESPQQQVNRIFTRALTEIGNREVGAVSDGAKRTLEGVSGKKITIAPAIPSMPGITGFDFEVRPASQSTLLAVPTIRVHIGRLLGAKDAGVQGDLARTAAIAGQIPDNGYQRSYRKIYEDAIEQQKMWLESTGSPAVGLDPRQMERETLLRTLLGEARYYYDFGIEDWKKKIDSYKQFGLDPRILDALGSDVQRFVSFREAYIPLFYQNIAAAGKEGEKYLAESTHERRKEIIIHHLVDSLLRRMASGPRG